ncbi:hypothetical protein [Natronorubrum daqingense]|uniref:Uncharacterized protein n=1 Tax=Natronorubrum daqingense TaxID=588898 RepID=A0A1N6YPT2_9EURY|nr:hypothetical protein [Natronorubrum daqingense]APX95599.1 hypothetical protein BB347_02640 [Natronorubrum daqingense]SIR16562.1 hypothetical protein SAMN05421809_0517 [Natronorubrum daqingense]
MLVTLVGIGFIALGLVGVRYAPAIVAAQHQEGMAPLEDGRDELDDTDRVSVTKWTGVAFVALGVVAVAYGVGIV